MTIRGKPISKWTAKRCIECNKIIRNWNKSGYCSSCYNKLKGGNTKNG